LPANTTASGSARRYATALFDLAAQRHALEQVEGDLGTLDRALSESPDFARMIGSPVLSREGQGRAVGALAERFGLGDIVRNFLGVLAKQRRLAGLPAMIGEFRRQLAAHRGEETAEVTSAVPLDEPQLAEIRNAVASYAGRPVQLTAAVDPTLLGGVVLRIGSRMVDASLKTKLQNLELSMRGLR
jgi:F-type H+-transporting ATPase subunit delta